MLTHPAPRTPFRPCAWGPEGTFLACIARNSQRLTKTTRTVFGLSPPEFARPASGSPSGPYGTPVCAAPSVFDRYAEPSRATLGLVLAHKCAAHTRIYLRPGCTGSRREVHLSRLCAAHTRTYLRPGCFAHPRVGFGARRVVRPGAAHQCALHPTGARALRAMSVRFRGVP